MVSGLVYDLFYLIKVNLRISWFCRLNIFEFLLQQFFIDFLKLIKTFSWVWHTGIPGLWMQVLNAGLWTLDAGCYTLDAGLWTLDTIVDCFRTESEPSFWFCLIQLLKIFWVRISKDLMVTLVLQRLSVLTWLFLD